mgnify:FL=1
MNTEDFAVKRIAQLKEELKAALATAEANAVTAQENWERAERELDLRLKAQQGDYVQAMKRAIENGERLESIIEGVSQAVHETIAERSLKDTKKVVSLLGKVQAFCRKEEL